jgi:hypothetical protein
MSEDLKEQKEFRPKGGKPKEPDFLIVEGTDFEAHPPETCEFAEADLEYEKARIESMRASTKASETLAATFEKMQEMGMGKGFQIPILPQLPTLEELIQKGQEEVEIAIAMNAHDVLFSAFKSVDCELFFEEDGGITISDFSRNARNVAANYAETAMMLLKELQSILPCASVEAVSKSQLAHMEKARETGSFYPATHPVLPITRR